jgi:membrane protease YdiL (CAAX protease family)
MTIVRRMFVLPEYPPAEADRRTVRVAGLELPVRASIALVLLTTIVLFDWSRTFIPKDILDLQLAHQAIRYQALVRVVLYLVVPLVVIVLVFRDRPSNYGLRLGDWRWGIALVAVGLVVMIPIAVLIGQQEHFREYYAPSHAPLPDLLVTYGLDIFSTEFAFRGFLLFTLVRAMGPLGLVVSQLPFVFGHLEKPEIELFTAFAGGLVYAWLAYRTGSMVWGAIAHVLIVVALVAAAGAAGPV